MNITVRNLNRMKVLNAMYGHLNALEAFLEAPAGRRG